jgi:hypothetical protein
VGQPYPLLRSGLRNCPEIRERKVRHRSEGSEIVISELAQGGNKTSGAWFVLRYIEKTKQWGKLERPELLAEDHR